MQVNGKEVTLRLDLGAMKKFKEITGKNFLALGKDEMDPEQLAGMIFALAVRGGSDITMDDVDAMTMQEISQVEAELLELTGKAEPGNPKKVSRQK